MPRFPVNATVKRVVDETYYLVVEADNEDAACAKAELVLQDFPYEHDIEGVPLCGVLHKDNLDMDVVSITIDR